MAESATLKAGHVVDVRDFYIKGYHWPAFNVADSAITVGVAFFLLAGYLDNDNVDHADQQAGSK
jgi:signal peptidase II